MGLPNHVLSHLYCTFLSNEQFDWSFNHPLHPPVPYLDNFWSSAKKRSSRGTLSWHQSFSFWNKYKIRINDFIFTWNKFHIFIFWLNSLVWFALWLAMQKISFSLDCRPCNVSVVQHFTRSFNRKFFELNSFQIMNASLNTTRLSLLADNFFF